MRAVTINGGGLVLAERPDPEPGRGELLVRVRAAGLNGADMHQLRGGYPAPPGSPADIPGLELAGEVAAVEARRAAVRARRPGDGRGRRRRPGRAGCGPRAPGRPGPRTRLGWPEAGSFPRWSPPPTTPCSPSAASAWATGCWSPGPPARSARPRSTGRRRRGPGGDQRPQPRPPPGGGRPRRRRGRRARPGVRRGPLRRGPWAGRRP